VNTYEKNRRWANLVRVRGLYITHRRLYSSCSRDGRIKSNGICLTKILKCTLGTDNNEHWQFKCLLYYGKHHTFVQSFNTIIKLQDIIQHSCSVGGWKSVFCNYFHKVYSRKNINWIFLETPFKCLFYGQVFCRNKKVFDAFVPIKLKFIIDRYFLRYSCLDVPWYKEWNR